MDFDDVSVKYIVCWGDTKLITSGVAIREGLRSQHYLLGSSGLGNLD